MDKASLLFFKKKNHRGAPYSKRTTTVNDGFELRLENGNFAAFRRELGELKRINIDGIGFILARMAKQQQLQLLLSLNSRRLTLTM